MAKLPDRQRVAKSVGTALRKMRVAISEDKRVAREAASWLARLQAEAQRGVSSGVKREAPPKPPNPATVLKEARERAARVTKITAAVGAWRETAALYERHKRGESVGPGMLWDSTKRVGRGALDAGRATNRRYITVVGLNTAAKVVAWKSAGRAAQSPIWKAIHFTSSRVAGRAGHAMVAMDVFVTLRSDLERMKSGDLSEEDFFRNCALTGVSILAPVVGASAGPLTATAGMVVSVGAGMARK